MWETWYGPPSDRKKDQGPKQKRGEGGRCNLTLEDASGWGKLYHLSLSISTWHLGRASDKEAAYPCDPASPRSGHLGWWFRL